MAEWGLRRNAAAAVVVVVDAADSDAVDGGDGVADGVDERREWNDCCVEGRVWCVEALPGLHNRQHHLPQHRLRLPLLLLVPRGPRWTRTEGVVPLPSFQLC